ncbi:MAG: hypothetical protein AAF725_26720 [Acidobacteriota bacterium]
MDELSRLLLKIAAQRGPSGVEWAESYRSAEPVAVRRAGHQAIDLLRKDKIEEGFEALEAMVKPMRSVRADNPSVVSISERWFYGAFAYGHYKVENYEAALDSLDLADQAILRGFVADSFLIVLTPCAYEFTLHRARIERNEGRREGMERYLKLARGMVDNEMPWYVLPDGSEIYRSDFDLYLSGLQLDAADRASIEQLSAGLSQQTNLLLTRRIRLQQPKAAA